MKFFATHQQWRAWLEQHHASETELVVGFWKLASGQPSMTWSESVDEALCFGWIDAVRRRVDDERYTIRFARRKATSTWSAINVAKVAALEADGRMTDAGRAAYAQRRRDRTAIYSYETAPAEMDESTLQADTNAWAFWSSQPPSYRKVATHWVTSAKRSETRERRLAQLVEDCAAGRRLASQRWA